MAYSIDGLLNLIKGSVKNCTFYLMNGQHVIRGKAYSVANPNTTEQQLNRLNIKPLLNYYRQLKPVLYLALNDRPEKQTTYIKFLSINLNKSIRNGIFEPQNLRITSESFPAADFQITRHLGKKDIFLITWTRDFNPEKLKTDKLICVYYDYHTNSFQYEITSKSRADLTASASFRLSGSNPWVIVYLFFVRSDYSKSSELFYQQFIKSLILISHL